MWPGLHALATSQNLSVKCLRFADIILLMQLKSGHFLIRDTSTGKFLLYVSTDDYEEDFYFIPRLDFFAGDINKQIADYLALRAIEVHEILLVSVAQPEHDNCFLVNATFKDREKLKESYSLFYIVDLNEFESRMSLSPYYNTSIQMAVERLKKVNEKK